MIRFISFDLWLTLIRSNPIFKKERAGYFATHFNPRGFSPVTIIDIIREVDVYCDRENEKTGEKIRVELMYKAILGRLGVELESLTPEVLSRIEQDLAALFHQYRPMYLHDRVPDILASLKEGGYRLNLSSNTGFIEGRFLRTCLEELNLADYFDFAVFSDEVNASKPSARFFELVWKGTGEVKKKEVLHIGDNYLADYLGARNFWFPCAVAGREGLRLYVH